MVIGEMAQLIVTQIQVLREIQEKFQMCLEFERLISDEKRRMEFLESQRVAKNNLLGEVSIQKDSVLSRKQSLEEELTQVEKRLSQLRSSRKEVQTEREQSLSEKELTLRTEEKDGLEIEILELLEDLEKFDQQIDDAKTFLLGLEGSKQEIQREVEESCLRYEGEISAHKSEIKDFLGLLPVTIKSQTLNLLQQKKFPILSPIVAEGCSQCRFGVSRELSTEIYNEKTIATCEVCQRFLIAGIF